MTRPYKYTASHGGIYEHFNDRPPRFRCVCSSLAQAEALAGKLNKLLTTQDGRAKARFGR